MRKGIQLAVLGAWALAAAMPAYSQTAYSPYAETPAAALARHVRTLASSPSDFSALIGAGKAALALGDTQAAAGFFARADDVNPKSPLPQAGMAAVSVMNGEAQGALPYFNRAQQLGEPVVAFACDRGLAYDLLGRQADAQKDYRLALTGPDSDEARRRLALSLAVGGNRSDALQTLAPLLAKADPAAARVRAFVLALTGDPQGAMTAIDSALPGSFSSVAPFLKRLPSLTAGQKVAAVNLGIFPDGPETSIASASSEVPAYSIPAAAAPQAAYAPPPKPSWQPAPPAPAPVQVAYAAPVARQQLAAPSPSTAPARKRIWLQLASGPNAQALPGQFNRIKSKYRELFDGISGYVAQSPDRARLIIGPFRSSSDAETFAEDLESVNVNSFSWTNSESDQIVPLGTQ